MRRAPGIAEVPSCGDELQKIPPEYHWAVADSSLLLAIADGTALVRGKWGRRLGSAVRAVSTIGMTYPFLALVGAATLARLLLQQRLAERDTNAGPRGGKPCAGPVERVFVGFGAGQEEQMYAWYCRESDAPVFRLDQTRPGTFAGLHRVSPVRALSSLRRALALARRAIGALPSSCADRKIDFLTYVGMRLGHFAYAQAWFEQLKERVPGIHEVCFLSPDTAAFAAVNAGLPTRHLQHGLIRHSLVLPAFRRIDALTREEAAHFRRRLPGAEVVLAAPEADAGPLHGERRILIASVYGSPEEMRRVVPLLEFAVGRGIDVRVRPHPREGREFWRAHAARSGIAMEDSDASFVEAMKRLRPCLVVSWFSTALADALAHGVVPVSLSPDDDPNVRDMVYPLSRRCLHWPADRELIERLVADEDHRQVVLSHLRSDSDGVPG